ncbi:MAG: class II aldolase/adducin family protein [Methylacidiphilales bacterium]|nr:class II aldolase/adducin family protein [Candidatus Methylacidiphilales bacterium]
MNDHSQKLAALLKLSHELGNPQHPLAILGEGNTSVRLDAKSFLVKASGSNLGRLKKTDVVQCKTGPLLALLDSSGLSDAEVDGSLMNSRADSKAKKPSVEALFHAWLLTLPGIEFVGHTHAPAVNGILCSPRAKEFAEKRIYPDEIVCCDVESVFVPYTDPGLILAQAIRQETSYFIQKYQRPPRVILLQNHGIITLGRTPESVLASMCMAEKTAAIWLDAAALGGPVFLSAEQVARISGRPDEALRRKALKI